MMDPLDKQARIAGALYLALALTGPFHLIYVPHTLIVPGNASATAGNILSHEMLFRANIVAGLLDPITFIFVVLALYNLLSRVSKAYASVMVALVMVSVAVGFANVLNNIAALTLVRGGDFLSAIDKPQRDALAMLFLRLHGQGNVITEIFWGLWLFPFGVLVMRSGFLPKIIGILLLINGFAYVAQAFTSLLFPGYSDLVAKWTFPALFGELWIMLWLLIKGAKVKSPTMVVT